MAGSAYRVVITAEAPLSFSQRKPGGIYQESLDYVPGSALRGAAAAYLLAGAMARHVQEGHRGVRADCDFCQLFLSDSAAIFGNAYPSQKPEEAGPYVLPTTAVSCKNHPGFRDEAEAHGVFDTLVDRLCWEALNPAGLVYLPNCPHPKCGERVDVFKTLFTRADRDTYHRQQVSQRLLTRVAINRRRAVAEEGLLYSPWVIEEVIRARDNGMETPEDEHSRDRPTQFVGYLYDADDRLADAIQATNTVGGLSSRGLNHVRVEAKPAQAENAADIEARVRELNELIENVWKLYRALGDARDEKKGTYFVLDLQSDAILHMPKGQPSIVLNSELLSEATGGAIGANEVNLVRSYASYHYGGGWNSAWRMPKPAEVCTDRGSVYLFHAQGGLSSGHYRALAALQQRGVGERKAEGYGQVRVCDEFHLVRREKSV
jgi:CRISPR-associated protein Csx10